MSDQDQIIARDQAYIAVNGSQLPADILNDLIRIEVESTLYLPDMVTIIFHDDELDLVDGDRFALGAALEVELDDLDGNSTSVFSGEITAVEPEFDANYTSTLTVRGLAKSHRLNRERKSQTFLNQKISDIVSTIASEGGLSLQVDATTTTHDYVVQDNQTDLEFLYHLASLAGYSLSFAEGKLWFKKRTWSAGEVTLQWGSTLRSFVPSVNVAGQVNEVIVRGWDMKAKKEVTGKATSSTTHPSVNLGGSGGDVTKKAVSAASRVVTGIAVVDSAYAGAVAQGILNTINEQFIQAEGRAEGNPNIKAGNKVKIEKIGNKFSGTYFVTTATHIWDSSGYVVDFRVEGSQPELMSNLVSGTSEDLVRRWPGVVPAVVTNNTDPDNFGRVKVKFDWLGDNIESDWARVAAPGAGKERGMLWLPEVDDEVLVAFEFGDFNHPYVVAGLWNGKDKPPLQTSAAVKSGKVEVRQFKTRAGHVITLDDTSGSEKIEIIDAKSKTSIVMDTASEQVTIKAGATRSITMGKSNIEVKASSNTAVLSDSDIKLTVGGSTITIGTAMIEIKSGSGSVKLDPSGVTVQGAMVKIN